MILDTLENIQKYKGLSSDIYSGLCFLRGLQPDVDLGSFFINEHIRVIVEEYETECNRALEFESHNKNIDIQYAIRGVERVFWSPIERMEVKTPYNSQKDCAIFVNPTFQPGYADIGNGAFAIMFGSDGHSPKHSVDHPQVIKKVTLKVAVE
ncbi:MAG: YhcH/YjgK/YiaL family protein [Paracoccaceae bacterium]